MFFSREKHLSIPALQDKKIKVSEMVLLYINCYQGENNNWKYSTLLHVSGSGDVETSSPPGTYTRVSVLITNHMCNALAGKTRHFPIVIKQC